MLENEMIAQNIRTIREERKLSQEDFANSVNLKRNSITLIENGKRNASDRTIKDICKVYNISEKWLRTGKGEKFKAVSEDAEYSEVAADIFSEKDEFKRKMYTALRNLDDTSWQVFKKFLEELKKE